MKSVARLAQHLRGRVMVNAGTKPFICVKKSDGEAVLETLAKTLEILRLQEDKANS